MQLHLKIGHVDMAKHIQEIKVRAHVVLALGYDLIRAGHAAYVKAREGDTLSHFSARMEAAREALKRRVQQRYPSLGTPEDVDGVVPPAVLRKVEEVQSTQRQSSTLTQDKHATPAEAAARLDAVFQGRRPQSVIGERVSDAGMDVAAQRTEVLRQYTPLDVTVNAEYVRQFHSLYPSQVFPFTFPYMVGGPEYFSRSEDSRRALTFAATGEYYEQFNVTSLPVCAKVPSRLWTAGVARRIEAQIQADWCAIPALRNLDFRHAMYAGSSLKFQTKVETADSLAAQAKDFCEAARNLYQHHLWHGYQVSRTGRKQYINGDITKLRFAHGLTAVEKKLLHNLGFKARTLSGSQELRLQMGHCLTGANVVHGTGVFITISPSERHSGLTLRLLRKRANDPWLQYGEPNFKALMQKLAAADYPSLETVTKEWAETNDCDYAEVALPEYELRRQAITNDILCCVEAFLVLVKVVLATLLGIRMCPKCPHCNANGSKHPCQDQFGSNMDTFGGIFGGCDGFGGGVESQRGGTLHLHLIAYIISVFQHATLARISEMIEAKLLSVAALERYMEWVSMHDPLDAALHENHVEDLEKQWRENFNHSSNDALGFVPTLVFQDASATMWDGADVPAAAEDASSYMSAYRRSGQFVLSRTNHHWHPKDSKTGERTPLNACIAKAQKKKKVKECKHGAPWTKQCTRRTKLVCAGVARKHHLKVTGQRNALGSFLIRRTDEWSRC